MDHLAANDRSRRLQKQFGAFLHNLRHVATRGLSGVRWVHLTADDTALLHCSIDGEAALISSRLFEGPEGPELYVHGDIPASGTGDGSFGRRLVWRTDSRGQMSVHPGDIHQPLGYLCDSYAALLVCNAISRNFRSSGGISAGAKPSASPFREA